jgi:hypothetical protein
MEMKDPLTFEDLRWCSKCECNVAPAGKGQCPVCGTFLPGHQVSRKHGVNVVRRDALLAELIAEFHPANIMDRATCEHLAATLSQLEDMRPGTMEWQRSAAMAQTLNAALRAAQPETRTPHLDAMPSSALERALPLLERLDRGETLTDYEQGQYDLLQAGMRGEVSLPPDRPGLVFVPTPGVEAPPPEPLSPVAVAPPQATAAPEPASPSGCQYCGQSPCIGPDHPNWPVLHSQDPIEVEKRRQYDTAVMLQTMKHGSGITRW